MLVVLPVDPGQAHREQNQNLSALISGFGWLVSLRRRDLHALLELMYLVHEYRV